LALQFPDFDPVAVAIPAIHVGSLALGPLPIHWYALAYIAGIALGYRYCVSLVRNPRLWGGRAPTAAATQVFDLMFWVTIGIIVGGRIGYALFYMLVNPEQRADLLARPYVIFEIWNGGMSFHGGFIGVALAVILFARRNGIDLLMLADLVAPCEPIGHFFVRIANFVNGELWGRVTHAPWGMIFCNAHIMAANNGVCPAGPAPRHPSQLYEAALDGLVTFLVLRWATHRAGWLQQRGAVFGLWLVCYGVFRTALEWVRNPDAGMPSFPFGLTMGMILSLPMFVVGAALLAWALINPRLRPRVATPGPSRPA
jgi:phosphatidylglycerol:prolipoprotein diacylglycerol transferase